MKSIAADADTVDADAGGRIFRIRIAEKYCVITEKYLQ